MSELDLRHPSIQGYPKEEMVLLIDLYRLISIFGSSEYISTFRSDRDDISHYSINAIFRNFEYTEISRLLISLAAQLRNILDNNCDIDEKQEFIVGEIKHQKKEEKEDLLLRDACNKILHAENINFDLSENNTIYSGYLNPIIYLYSNNSEYNWKAKLDIKSFTKCIFKNI